MLQALVRAGPEAVDGHRETSHAHLAHGLQTFAPGRRSDRPTARIARPTRSCSRTPRPRRALPSRDRARARRRRVAPSLSSKVTVVTAPSFAPFVVGPDEAGVWRHLDVSAEERHGLLRGRVAHHQTVRAAGADIGLERDQRDAAGFGHPPSLEQLRPGPCIEDERRRAFDGSRDDEVPVRFPLHPRRGLRRDGVTRSICPHQLLARHREPPFTPPGADRRGRACCLPDRRRWRSSCPRESDLAPEAPCRRARGPSRARHRYQPRERTSSIGPALR